MTYRIIELGDRKYIEITDSYANVYGYGGKAGNNITRVVMAVSNILITQLSQVKK
jgi:hypothetical protein